MRAVRIDTRVRVDIVGVTPVAVQRVVSRLHEWYCVVWTLSTVLGECAQSTHIDTLNDVVARYIRNVCSNEKVRG